LGADGGLRYVIITARNLTQLNSLKDQLEKHGIGEHKAIDIARRQKARFFELRATTSLARLLKRQGKTDEARAMLSGIYNWFTEGFEFADLKDAKALLEELGA
jgi:hypothetical protein